MTVDDPRYTTSSLNIWFKGKIDLDAKKLCDKEVKRYRVFKKIVSKILNAIHSHSDKGPQTQLV